MTKKTSDGRKHQRPEGLRPEMWHRARLTAAPRHGFPDLRGTCSTTGCSNRGIYNLRSDKPKRYPNLASRNFCDECVQRLPPSLLPQRFSGITATEGSRMPKTFQDKLNKKYATATATAKGKYRITIDFETTEELPEAVLDEVASHCFVQLESLSDGDIGSANGERFSIAKSDYTVVKV